MSGGVAGVARAPEAVLAGIVGSGRVLHGEEASMWAVPRHEPPVIVYPADAGEVTEVLRAAAQEGWWVVPAGAGTWVPTRTRAAGARVVLSTARMDRILQYEPADLTLRAESGVALEALEKAVEAEGQWLPLDPPGTRAATLGGIVATGIAGSLQAGYGSPRDHVLGLTIVTGDGRTLRLGGGVVKNVAGFDLVRLLVGSRGTLGVVTEVALRLHPRPSADRTLVLRAETAQELTGAALAVATARVVPAAVELCELPRGWSPTAPDGTGGYETLPPGAFLAVRLVGSERTVERETEVLQEAAPGLEPVEPGLGSRLFEVGRRLQEDTEVGLRLAVRPRDLEDALELHETLGRLEGARNELAAAPVRLACHVTGCVLRVAVPNIRTDGPWAERWGQRLEDVRGTVERRGGSLMVSHGPAELVARVGVSGGPGPGVARLMEGLRARFDPDRVLAPSDDAA